MDIVNEQCPRLFFSLFLTYSVLHIMKRCETPGNSINIFQAILNEFTSFESSFELSCIRSAFSASVFTMVTF